MPIAPLEPWPNQNEIIDGVVPAEEVSQEPHIFDNDVEADLDVEMEV